MAMGLCCHRLELINELALGVCNTARCLCKTALDAWISALIDIENEAIGCGKIFV